MVLETLQIAEHVSISKVKANVPTIPSFSHYLIVRVEFQNYWYKWSIYRLKNKQ